ncbi:GntR family transcriptional regulator [Deinococcus deserti]|uniref:Putative transcriptional regulator, GntR familly n=1 Tax=Deinococcus deserti (strain DSM 17065 / CIP 109153 / LMG 22923 / VCD115) TaxID=546414 RepID=C1D3B4_DEIDV|nr:GntR family transcriptional regulator [Deinococcus deserti]ACO47993.2 putative transcriptional regulator, GntR familly [Deinococcus deserti VCD115]
MPQEGEADTSPFVVDRTLSVPLSVQLRGQIEYGIACGELPPGARLPSVRDLVAQTGVAHVTVAHVYRDLAARGLIVTVAGRGTFVADPSSSGPMQDVAALRGLLNDVLFQAERDGIEPERVVALLQAMIARGHTARDVGVRIVLVGVLDVATRAYARELQALLRPEDRVKACTFIQLAQPALIQEVRSADIVLTLGHRLAEARALLPGLDILPMRVTVSHETREHLAALAPDTRLALIATFDDFLPTFLTGVHRYAPQVLDVRAAHLAEQNLPELLAWCDAAVYASGADGIVTALNPGTFAFEYRHAVHRPDAERTLLPVIAQHRALVRERKHHEN